jgi:hypothetical protein
MEPERIGCGSILHEWCTRGVLEVRKERFNASLFGICVGRAAADTMQTYWIKLRRCKGEA